MNVSTMSSASQQSLFLLKVGDFVLEEFGEILERTTNSTRNTMIDVYDVAAYLLMPSIFVAFNTKETFVLAECSLALSLKTLLFHNFLAK